MDILSGGWSVGRGTVLKLTVVWALAGLLCVSAAACMGTREHGVQTTESGNSWGDADGYHGLLLEPLEPAPDFTMEDQRGDPFRVSDRGGKALLMFFGYTHCPDICLITLADYVQVRDLLGGLAEEVEFAFITVDPERDTPGVVGEYVGRFDTSFYGLRGSDEVLEDTKSAYGIFAEASEGDGGPDHDDGGYLVGHTDHSFLIDGEGRLAVLFRSGTPAAEMAADIERLLG